MEQKQTADINQKKYKDLLSKAYRTLPREKIDELEELYVETKKNPELIKATIESIRKMKSPLIAQLLSIFGFLGLDRFYIGDTRSGFTKLLTLGGILVFWIYDWFGIRKRTKFNNYLSIRKAMGAEVEIFDLDKLNK